MVPTYVHANTLATDFVVLGSTRESIVLEFKERYGTGAVPAFELRKDIVALANTWGGVLVIGVAESGSDTYNAAAAFRPVEVDSTLDWVSSTLAVQVYPPVNWSPAPILVPTDGPGRGEHALAINVHPYPDGVGCVLPPDGRGMVFPKRDDFGVKYFRPDEVFTIMASHRTRAIRIALNELVKPGQTVTISSALIRRRLEDAQEMVARLGDPMRFNWLAQRNVLAAAAEATSRMVEESLPGSGAQVYDFDERALRLQLPNSRTVVAVPLGLVREVWKQVDGTLGVVLDCDIVVDASGATLRVR